MCYCSSSVNQFKLYLYNSVSGASNVDNFKKVNIVNSAQAVYSALLPPSLMVFLLSS